MSLLVAIPALNEERSIADVIKNVKRELPNCEVLVIDDGSTDNTVSVAKKEGATVISLPFNVGVGGAMRVAFKFASAKHFSQVLQIDADGQHLPSEAKTLVSNSVVDSVVLGSRFLNSKNNYQVGFARRIAMKLLAKVTGYICGIKLTDVTSGFRLTSGTAVELFAREYPREYLGDTVESLIIAHRNSIQIIEVPVSMEQRQHGLPSQNFIKSFWYLIRALIVITLAIFKKKQDMK